MNYDKLERKNILAHFQGELKKGQPRKVFNEKLLKELMDKKIMVSQSWAIKLEVPADMCFDCEKAMGWVQARIHKFVGKGFFHLGTEAAIKEANIDGNKRDEPFWFIHIIHPEYRDPRTVEDCVDYGFTK